jgi:hypothetical protein
LLKDKVNNGVNEVMKRLAVFLILSMFFLLTACSVSVGNSAEKSNKVESAETNKKTEKKALTLQVTKADANKGVTIDNSQLYQSLNNLIKENPYIGKDNNFGMYALDIGTNEAGQKMFAFIAVNRIHQPIKNVSFDFTYGNKNGKYLWEKKSFHITEDKIGAFQPQSAIPVLVPLTEEQYALAKSLNKENSVMKIEKLKFKTAK